MSAHFELAEFLHSDTALAQSIANLPTWQDVANLERLADTMERVRSLLGDAPIMISSGYRSPDLNKAVGGVHNSAHLEGLACDFVAPAFGGVAQVCARLEPHLVELGVDQLINESGGRWVHLGLSTWPPRHQSFSA